MHCKSPCMTHKQRTPLEAAMNNLHYGRSPSSRSMCYTAGSSMRTQQAASACRTPDLEDGRTQSNRRIVRSLLVQRLFQKGCAVVLSHSALAQVPGRAACCVAKPSMTD